MKPTAEAGWAFVGHVCH